MTEKFTPAPYIDCQLKAEVERKIKTTNYYLETFATQEESITATRLYSVAPDLYQALAAVVDTHRGVETFVIQNARKALAKARGE